ncbi:hypothetical protein AF72_07095 [Xylella taiwanensis]|uniref:Uncharacterized protein n=1 Tax=Xylella taiwanensis TaxID=1444770 RepID=Z9JJH2_9GAMM|nr:hypothetical protein AB672_10785 [Xylella taiwanensis]EWS78118.1 hypothetical protein AF72_07095 [Xylella taiwanensis]
MVVFVAFADFGCIQEKKDGGLEWGRMPKSAGFRTNPREHAGTGVIWQEKNPNRERLGFSDWWRWAESNRRPKVLHPRPYMLILPLNLAAGQHDRQSAPGNQSAGFNGWWADGQHQRFRDDDSTLRARIQAVSRLRP